jgi:magnesium transporter
MLYEYGQTVREITVDQINPEHLTAGLISLAELKACGARLSIPEATIAECESGDESFRGGLDAYDEYSFTVLSLIDPQNVLGDRDRIGFYLRRNLFLLVSVTDDDKSTERLFLSVIRQLTPGATMEKLLSRLLDRLICHDGKAMEAMDIRIEEMEGCLGAGKADKQFYSEILRFRKELLVLRSYYEQLTDVGESLLDNAGGLFPKSAMPLFRLFTQKLQRLSGNLQIIRESLAQLREAYQAQLDISLNSTMKLFTVMTTIFLPLTLIVGWYGMNFKHMPELEWVYGYPGVLALSAIVVTGCLLLFKKKKLL